MCHPTAMAVYVKACQVPHACTHISKEPTKTQFPLLISTFHNTRSKSRFAVVPQKQLVLLSSLQFRMTVCDTSQIEGQ